MLIKPDAAIADLIGRRPFAPGETGLQEAHIIGRKFYEEPELAWMEPLLGVNENANLLLLPESERGSAILGAAAHMELERAIVEETTFR